MLCTEVACFKLIALKTKSFIVLYIYHKLTHLRFSRHLRTNPELYNGFPIINLQGVNLLIGVDSLGCQSLPSPIYVMSATKCTEFKRVASAAENEQDLLTKLKYLMLVGVHEEHIFIGEGAFGGVYRAVYGGVACAVKRQSFEQDFCLYTIQDFHQECLLHSKLHHPNVVKMYGVCYHGDQPMKVMELVNGGTLSLLLRYHHTIPMYVKLSLLQDVSRGLRYLHFSTPPIMHHHINTDIILLTSTLTAKIGSFTFAKEGAGHRHGLSFDVFLFFVEW